MDTNEEDKEWDWKRTEIPVNNYKYFNSKFCGHQTNFTLETSIFEIFSLFFTPSLISHIVKETNLYAGKLFQK